MIYVNGQPTEVRTPTTIRDVLIGIDIDPDAPGIAVAVDAEVATRGAWPTHEVDEGAHVEIVTATQGG